MCFISSSLQPSLLPLLLLLSRLYPSPLDDANSPTSLTPFIPLLIRYAEESHLLSFLLPMVVSFNSFFARCTCCSVWKTRVLVSRAASLMLTEHNCWTVLSSLYDLMDMEDQNRMHGLLLIVSRSLQDRGKLLAQTANDKQSVLCCLLQLHLTNIHIGTE